MTSKYFVSRNIAHHSHCYLPPKVLWCVVIRNIRYLTEEGIVEAVGSVRLYLFGREKTIDEKMTHFCKLSF